AARGDRLFFECRHAPVHAPESFEGRIFARRHERRRHSAEFEPESPGDAGGERTRNALSKAARSSAPRGGLRSPLQASGSTPRAPLGETTSKARSTWPKAPSAPTKSAERSGPTARRGDGRTTKRRPSWSRA